MVWAASSAQYRAVAYSGLLVTELLRHGYATAVTGGGVPHDELVARVVEHEDAPVVDTEEVPGVTRIAPQGEAPVRDGVGGVHRGMEDGIARAIHEHAQEGRLQLAGVVATNEARAGDDAAPNLADGSGAGERRGMRREAEEDICENVFVFQSQRGRCLGAASAAAGHGGGNRQLACSAAGMLILTAGISNLTGVGAVPFFIVG